MTDSPEFRRQQAEMQELRGFLENTMTEKKQPEALRLADAIGIDDDWYPGYEITADDMTAAAAKLRRQHALIEEMRDVIVACKKELDLMPKSFAYDIHPGRQIDRVLAKVDAQS